MSMSCEDCGDNGLSQRAIMGIIVVGVAVVLSLAIFFCCLRRHASHDRGRNQPSNPPAPFSTPGSRGYPVHHRAARPAPLPLKYLPPFAPSRTDEHHGYSQPLRQSFSSVRTVPEPVTPRASMRPPSSVRASSASSLLSSGTPPSPSISPFTPPSFPSPSSGPWLKSPGPPSHATRPFGLSPTGTGTSTNNVGEPPPAYTAA